MSCVTKQSLNKDIKNIILTEDWSSLGIKSTLSTKNSTSTTYSDRVEVFIPFDSVNPSKNTLYGKLKNLESQINKVYQSDVYDNIISFFQQGNGATIVIRANNKIVTALNKKYSDINENYQLPSIEGKIVVEKTIKDLAARISDRIGIPYKIESDRTREYKGKIENDVAYINLAYATLDTVPHEILAHPIIRTLKIKSEQNIDVYLQEMIDKGIITKEC